MAEQQGDITIIGSDAHFKGELAFERAARVNGKFDGKIAGKGELHINDNALAKADIEAGSVNVDGRIEGNVVARETVRLNTKGVIKGDIVAAKMLMAEGASFFGQCAVGPDAQRNASGGGGGGAARPGQVPPTGGAGAQAEPPRK
jgi:cytoskeletal protein CcmA (bactofilin family)